MPAVMAKSSAAPAKLVAVARAKFGLRLGSQGIELLDRENKKKVLGESICTKKYAWSQNQKKVKFLRFQN